jgi:TetR/AcrR family transcriptional regulator
LVKPSAPLARINGNDLLEEKMSMPAPEAPHSETESRLLDAAEAVFAERGYRAATTAAIAERAGLNKTLIHYYFRSKEGLFRAMMERVARNHAMFLDDLAHADPVTALTKATHRFVHFLADNPNYVRLCAYCALEGTEGQVDEEMMQGLVQAATSAIQRGIDQGLFLPEDPRHVLASVEGMVRFFFEHEDNVLEMWGPSQNRQEIVDERAQHVVRMLLRGLGVENPEAIAKRTGPAHQKKGDPQ